MTDLSRAPSFHVVLSHGELVYLLRFFGVQPMVGVDRDPLADLPMEQVAVALETAGHALRARDLLRFDEAQQPVLADDLMRVLSAYADPHQMVSAYRYRTDDALPLAFFGYRQGDDAVIHTRPADLLHEFTLVREPGALIAALATFCAGAAPGELPRRQLALPAQAIAAARAYADAGRTQEVMQVLLAAGLSEPNAQLLAVDLVTPTALTTATLLVRRNGGAPGRRDFVYWQSERSDSAMVIVEQGAEVLITDGSAASIATIVNEMV